MVDRTLAAGTCVVLTVLAERAEEDVQALGEILGEGQR
jgi:hypothetical protein